MARSTTVPLLHPESFFIGGSWVAPSSDAQIDVIDAGTEEVAFSVAEAEQVEDAGAVGAVKHFAGSWSGFGGVARNGQDGNGGKGGSEGECRTSKRNCTAVEVLLTCWPPGPAARTKLSSISDGSSAIDAVTLIGAARPAGKSLTSGLRSPEATHRSLLTRDRRPCAAWPRSRPGWPGVRRRPRCGR